MGAYKWDAIFIGVVVAVLGAFGFGYGWANKSCEIEKKDDKIKVIEKVITIREKQNEIRNNRPNASGVAKRLRAGTF
jgi:hypothetical protein